MAQTSGNSGQVLPPYWYYRPFYVRESKGLLINNARDIATICSANPVVDIANRFRLKHRFIGKYSDDSCAFWYKLYDKSLGYEAKILIVPTPYPSRPSTDIQESSEYDDLKCEMEGEESVRDMIFYSLMALNSSIVIKGEFAEQVNIDEFEGVLSGKGYYMIGPDALEYASDLMYDITEKVLPILIPPPILPIMTSKLEHGSTLEDNDEEDNIYVTRDIDLDYQGGELRFILLSQENKKYYILLKTNNDDNLELYEVFFSDIWFSGKV